MNDIRARFEEIWPVPEGVCWAEGYGEYMPMNRHSIKHSELACEWDARLDTFTRCQETTEPVMSLIQELVWALEAESYYDHKRDLIVSAKQIMEKKK